MLFRSSVFVKRKGDIFYQEANVREITSTFNDLQTDTKYFDFVEYSDAPYRIMLNYDLVTNDKLYYTLEGAKELSDFKLYILMNENYHKDFDIGSDLAIQEMTGYNLNYECIEVEDIGSVTNLYRGIITVNTETIYIEYNQIFDIGEQAFFDDIESIIKVKS